MAEGLNRVILLGNLGADPELRMTNSGSAVLNMRLAVSESYLDANKQRQERTEWVNCVVWGKRAEALGRILKKGDRILVEGSLRTSSFEKDGEKKFRTDVVASNVVLSGGGGAPSGERSQGGGRGESSGSRYGSRGYPKSDPNDGPGPDPSDDIPF